MAKQTTKKPKVSDYENLGRLLENIYESGYADRGRVYKMSFVKGVMAGFGGVVGATIVVTLLLWILSLFHYVPFLNRITDNVQCTISQHDANMVEQSNCQKPE